MQDTNLPAEVVANMRQFEEQTKSTQVQLRARITLDALNQIGRYLANIPGRKNLIWFSGAFPINILPFTTSDSSATIPDPFAVMASFEQEFRETAPCSPAARWPSIPSTPAASPPRPSSTPPAAATTPPIPAVSTPTSPDSSRTPRTNTAPCARWPRLPADAPSSTPTASARPSPPPSSPASNFYTLAYTPSAAKSGDDFRRIKIKTTQSGVNLEYRRGYYAEQPPKPTTAPAANVASTSTPAHSPVTMQSAMLRGSPTPSQIVFKARVLPDSTAPTEAPAPDNHLNPALKNKGPYRLLNIDVAADANAMQFNPTPQATYRGAVEIVTFVYDLDGNVINSVYGTTTVNVTQANYARLLHIGLPFHQQVSVPAKGTWFLRIAVHDLTSDRVGAIELPVAAVKNLPPLPAPPASPPSTPPAAVAPH